VGAVVGGAGVVVGRGSLAARKLMDQVLPFASLRTKKGSIARYSPAKTGTNFGGMAFETVFVHRTSQLNEAPS
jgi:hypothetical protein